MRGTITTRHVLRWAPLVLREFGLRCLVRCLTRGVLVPGTTFLECVDFGARGSVGGANR